MSVHGIKSKKYNLIGGGLPLGCKVLDGRIIPTLSGGYVNTTCPKPIRFATFSHNLNSFFVFYGRESYTFLENEGKNFSRMASEVADIPFVIEFKVESGESITDIIYNKTLMYYQVTRRTLLDYPNYVGGGVYKNGRVFAIDLTDTTRIRWTGEGGVNDWEERIDGAGWLFSDVELGEIYRLYVLKGQIVALRKYGISLINAYGTPEDFKEILSIATPPPYKECATVCGNKLYFYTVDGLYTFTAAGVEKVHIKLAEDFTSAVYSMTYGDSVFFAGMHKKLGRTVILVFNTKENSSYFIDAPATALCAASGPYAFTDEGMVKLEKGLAFRYESEEFAHFSKRNKTLKKIFIDSATGVNVTVQTDKVKRLFKGVKGEFEPHVCGRYFKVDVEGKDGEIKELTATVEYY